MKMNRCSSLGSCLASMKSNKVYMGMLLIQLIYAGMALFSKAAISKGMNPYVFVFSHQAFATLALAPFAFFLKHKNSAPLSYNLVCQIFLVSLSGITLSLNLYCFAINYTLATLAAASSNTVPAITFIMVVLLRCVWLGDLKRYLEKEMEKLYMNGELKGENNGYGEG
ncbi:hypothetical protein ACSBR2_001115 [Camellia fascicularis]